MFLALSEFLNPTEKKEQNSGVELHQEGEIPEKSTENSSKQKLLENSSEIEKVNETKEENIKSSEEEKKEES